MSIFFLCLLCNILTIVMPTTSGVTKYMGGLGPLLCCISWNEWKRSAQQTIHNMKPNICRRQKIGWRPQTPTGDDLIQIAKTESYFIFYLSRKVPLRLYISSSRELCLMIIILECYKCNKIGLSRSWAYKVHG